MVASNAGSGPRYAPVDPTLPPPWRALVDGNTGYIYYWNTETNVTQYEKPLPAPPPPLPAGPPPVAASSAGPNVAVGPSATSSGTTDHQNARSSEGRSSADGSVPSNALVSPHGSGGNVHGMTGAIAHAGGGGSSFANSSGSGSGRGTAGGVTLPGNIYGNSNNAPVHARGPISASGPRSGSGISGGTVHMNASDKSFGSSGRHTPGSSRGPIGGVPGGNVHVSAVRSANVPAQPKLAALPVPQRQQGIGGMHMPLQPRQMGHVSSSGPRASVPPGMGPASAYKRVSSDHMNSGPDIHKKPRMQGFSDPPLTLEVDAYKRQHEITVKGDNVPPPFMTFDAANFPREIARELLTAGFSAPTPIQAQSWPIALQSRDIVAIAKTGSGKTLGYLLPAFVHLSSIRINSQFGPVVLVLAPTRELATQIHDEAVKFGRSSRISCTCVYGGAPKAQQLRELDRGSDIVIATPGRLNDFLEMRKVSLRQVSYLVLDEADRMLDMGFEPQIRKIVNEIPPRRQTLMYTATWPKEVRKIASDLLVNAVQVNIGNSDELTANKAITQNVEIVSVFEKQRRLEQILRSQEPGSKILIFCSTKKMCDQLARSLGRGFGASAIHGDKSQSERDFVLAQFKTGRSPILVATDVAARGLDIKDIRVVINFDFPTGVEDYVHRIGRTGRAGATGVAFTFFSEQDSKYAKELIKVLEGANQKVPSELRNLAGKSFHPKGRPGRWDGMGGRDGGYNAYRGGRGDGRGDGFGGRGSWGPPVGQVDRHDRNFNRFGDQERFLDRNAFHDKYSADRIQSRDGKKFGAHERGRSYSRSYSRSPNRSRGRSYSRSRSPDRYSDDHYRRFPHQRSHSYRSRSPYRNSSPYNSRSPYRSVSPRSPHQSRSKSPHISVSSRSPYQGRRKSPHRSVSPRSPYEGRSPYTHSRLPIASNNPQRLQQPSLQSTEPKFSADSKDCQAPDLAVVATADSKALIATSDSRLLGPATVAGTHREIEEFVQPVQQEKMSVECIDATGRESNLVDKDGGL